MLMLLLLPGWVVPMTTAIATRRVSSVGGNVAGTVAGSSLRRGVPVYLPCARFLLLWAPIVPQLVGFVVVSC